MRRLAGRLTLLATTAALASCASGRAPPAGFARATRVPAFNRPYQVRGRWYSPHAQPGYDAVGIASWYSYEAPGRRTADGEPFDIAVASAAHTTLPIPGWLEVTNLDNGRRARVRLNDRGPFVAGRLLDVSRGAAEALGFVRQGTARVRVRYLGPAAPLAGARAWTTASAPALAAPVPSAPAPTGFAVAADAAPDPSAEVAEDVATSAQAILAAPQPDAASPPPSPSAPAEGGFEVQVAAFAQRVNAERASARLAWAGPVRIEPLRRDAGVLYRVTLGAWSEARDADAARSRVIALGFSDARVVAR